MKTVFRWLIQFYRLFVSPMLGPRCRFYPTCSQYALEALEQHSLHHASWLIAKRLGRCHPWGGSGYDPVPPRHSAPDDVKSSDSKDGHEKRSELLHASPHCSCHSNAAFLAYNVAASTIDERKNSAASFANDENRHRTLKFTPYTSQPRETLSIVLRLKRFAGSNF